ncbi:N-6 DNA methylase [Granulicella sp. WH15]|uniref:class I SAM-dependent DNA methyltransferase n=1 Tax=Granulicella sp. WH15 TaxID=2602070 RepID=UPI001C702685|nr:N-6 DNA methylase [Granulicella sp. WH15]
MKRSAKKLVTPNTTAQQLSTVIAACRKIMRKDKGLSTDVERLPLLTWVMFLKFLDDMESLREQEATLAKKHFSPGIEAPYRWRDWAAQLDGITGSELISFISQDKTMRPDGKEGPGLFAYLRALQSRNGDRRDVIARVFKDTVNPIRNGYLLRDVINKVNEIHFTSRDEVHTLSLLYESILREIRDAAGTNGEFYTPRAVVKFMVTVINPLLGESVLDPAAGTGGFLVEAFQHLVPQARRAQDFASLQRGTLFGVEAKPLPYLLCQMNLLLHGIEYPDIDPENALRFPLREIGDKERVDIVLTNPPFGGEEERGILTNFPSDKQTAETALLFLQLIMRKLRRPIRGAKPGRCGVIVPNGFLSGEGVAARIKDELLTDFNLHTVVRLPNGVFSPYTPIPANLLFFDRSGPTKDIWFYEQPLPAGKKNYSKTAPIQWSEFGPCLAWWKKRKANSQAWKVSVDQVRADGFNLDLQNPNRPKGPEQLSPIQIIDSLLEKEQRVVELLKDIKQMVAGS